MGFSIDLFEGSRQVEAKVTAYKNGEIGEDKITAIANLGDSDSVLFREISSTFNMMKTWPMFKLSQARGWENHEIQVVTSPYSIGPIEETN